MKRRRAALALMISWLTGASVSQAQQAPLLTEDPQPIPAGHVLVETGIDVEFDRLIPISGLEGDLIRSPRLGLSFGLSRIAEFQIDAGFNVLLVNGRREAPLSDMLEFDGDTTTDIEDPVVGIKIRLKEETPTRPAFAMRVATRLPSAGNDSGLGNDTIDFFLSILGGKSFGRTRVVGNFGMAVLPVPTRGDRQNDVLTYGFSITRTVGQAWTLAGEIHGRVDVKGETPEGTEDRGQARLGLRYSLGAVRLDGAVLFGLNAPDPATGFTFGITHMFRGFDGI